MKSLEVRADSIRDIAGHRVMTFEEKWEGDVWKIHITFLGGNVVLCATDEGLIQQTLARKDSGVQREALPESLPEWEHVDRQGQTWAIRHYDKDNAARDPSSPLSGYKAAYNVPDPQATGLVMTFDPSRTEAISVKYLSANPEALRIAKEYWEREGYAKPQIQTHGEGVVEISSAERGSGPFILLVLGALGHGIYI